MDSDGASLVAELNGLRRVLAVTATKGMIQKDQIGFLNRAGFTNTEIAAMVGTSSHNVDQTLHTIRKRGSKPRAGRTHRKR
jgi:hypothetical protein